MLFEKLLDGITTIIEFIARVILFLLKALGLWIPALYSLLFVLLCAIFKVNFTEVLAIYLVGLAVSMIFAFYIMFLRVMKRKERRYMEKQEKRAQGKLRKNLEVKDEKNKENVQTENKEREVKPQVEQPQTAPIQPTNAYQPQTYQPYYNPAQPFRPETTPTLESYQPVQTNAVPPQYVSPKEQEEPLMTSSKPLIFRTRMDPNLLIYEYSDRLVFYKKTLNGLEHVKTERKDPMR